MDEERTNHLKATAQNAHEPPFSPGELAPSRSVIRAVIYHRVASAQSAGASFERQRQSSEEYLRKCGYRLVETYADVGKSGLTAARVGYQQMIRDAEQGLFDVVVADGIQRYARSHSLLFQLHRNLNELGVQLHSADRGLITALPLQHMLVKGYPRRWPPHPISTLRRVAAEAGRDYSPASYGYRRSGPASVEKCEQEAATIRLIYNLLIEGLTIEEVVLELNKQKIPSPKGAHWTRSALTGKYHRSRASSPLLNPRLIGCITYNRTELYRDPVTGSAIRRMKSFSDWVCYYNNDLRIVSDNDFLKICNILAKSLGQIEISHFGHSLIQKRRSKKATW
jgi:hypothetical protein